MQQQNFWQPPKWKWLVVTLLLGTAMLLWRTLPQSRLPKPKLLQRARLIPLWNGSLPKFVTKWDTAPTKRFGFDTSIAFSQPTCSYNAPLNQSEVDLHSGEFVLRQTDFFISDVIPVALIRTYHSWDYQNHAFGMGNSHPYDIAPVGTRNPYTYIDLVLEDGREVHFDRISEGTGYADAVYEHDETTSEFYGARITWNGQGWGTFAFMMADRCASQSLTMRRRLPKALLSKSEMRRVTTFN